MKTWMGALALVVAGIFAAAPALAQGTSQPAASPSDTKAADTPKSDTMKSDTMKPADKDSMKGDKAAKGARGGASANAEQVKAVQQALKDQGHDPGDIDGKMGPRTQAALRDYQTKQGLKATGQLDSETMAKLGTKTSSTGTSSSSPAASPSTSPAPDKSAAPSASPAPGKADSKTDTSAKPEAQPAEKK